MALPLVEQDVSAFLEETIVIETPVTITGSGLDDLSGFTATYQAAEQGAAVPDTITVTASIGAAVEGVVTITTTIGSTEAEAATYAHQLSVTDGVNTYVVMTGQLTVIDALADDLHYFTLTELRVMDAAFASTTDYLDSDLTEIQSTVEEAIECAAHVAFVPRTATATVSGDGGRRIFLPHFEVSAISAVTVDGTALTSDELAGLVINDAILYRETGWTRGYRNISVTYTHGRTAVPGLIKRAALILAKSYLTASQIPANATAQSIGDTMFRLTIAGRDGDFGIPEVDAAIKMFGRSGHWVG